MPAISRSASLRHQSQVIDVGLTNIVAHCDADPAGRTGREGHDMGRVGPVLRLAVVGSLSYFASRKRTRTPQDLTQHNCVNLHLPTHGGRLYAWEFERNGRDVNVRVDGQLVFNSSGALLQAALQGLGLAYLTESQVQPFLSSGELVRVLADWCPPFSGYHLYYPSRRQSSPAFSLLIDALRYKRR